MDVFIACELIGNFIYTATVLVKVEFIFLPVGELSHLQHFFLMLFFFSLGRTVSVFGLYLISGMNSLNERSGTRSLSTTALLLPAFGSVPAAAAKGEAPAHKGRGSCGY